MKELTQVVNDDLTVRIVPQVSAEDFMDQPMFAINWLDLRSKFLYNLYGYLAFPLAQKVGAKAIFKGYQTDLVQDPAQVNRQVLLIVKYPNPGAFLSLLSRKIFQIISLVRIRGVKNFNLGFSRLLEGSRGEKKDHYLVYHYQSGSIKDQLTTLQTLIGETNVQIFFAAEKVAALHMIRSGKDREVNLPMKGLIIFSHPSQEALAQIINHPLVKELLESNDGNYLSFFKRVI